MSHVILLDRDGSDFPHKTKLYEKHFPTSTNKYMQLLYSKHQSIFVLCSQLKKCDHEHTPAVMKAAGLRYTDEGDTARCDDCEWQHSGWTREMNPFKMHAQNSPRCPYILSIKVSDIQNVDVPATSLSISDSASLKSSETRVLDSREDESSGRKRQKLEAPTNALFSDNWKETPILEKVRRRTFSHWPHRHSPTSAQMIAAGFISCNVGDRVICIYCNLICQQWTPHGDDPCEVHKILSPNCVFVISKLLRRDQGAILIVNETSNTTSSTNNATSSDRNQPFRSQALVDTVACHPIYAELPKRHASFVSWPDRKSVV